MSSPVSVYPLYAVWVLVPTMSLLLGTTKTKFSAVAVALLVFFGTGVLVWLGMTQSVFTEILAIVTLGGSSLVLFLENMFLLGFIAVVAYLTGWLIATALGK